MKGLATNLSTPFRLSSEQKAVIAHRGGDLQVIACAGSGKTESISRRIAGLIGRDGVEPASIVAFTFTERAAAQMKERITKRVAEVKGKDFLDRLGPMFVGTIHSYCFRILQDHVPKYGNYDVLDDHRHVGLLSREFHGLGLRELGGRPIQEWIRTVDVIGNELIDPTKLNEPVAITYLRYRDMLDRYHLLTFSLIIQCAVESLEDPVIYERVHGPLRYLVVDEYQDINPAQERLIEILARRPVELCVVGDDDQCIYQWRGSEIRNILTFTRRRRKATTLPLSDNRRSRPQIIRVANRFIAKAVEERLPKAMRPVRHAGTNEIVAWSAETPTDEAQRIAETIQRLARLGCRYRDIGILCRSVRTSAPPIIEALKAREIPYSCGGRTGLFLQPEINVIGEIYAWFVDGTWREERFGAQRDADPDHILDELRRLFPTAPKPKVLRQYLQDWKAWYLQGIRPVNLVGDFYKLLFRLGAQEIDVDTPVGSARFGAFARFTTVLADFEHTHRRGRYLEEDGARRWRGGRDRGKEYLQALHRYLLYYARDAYEDFEGELLADTDAVNILTVHQAKGLEWPIVFIPALTDRRFPSSLTGRPQNWLLDEDGFSKEKRRRYEGGVEEESRLFYVALTRARDCVYLSCFRRQARTARPSQFLKAVGGDDLISSKKLPLPGPPEPIEGDERPALEASVSDIALYEDCGHRYRLANQLGFQQEIAVELGYGKAIHHVLRRIAETTRDTGKIPNPRTLEALVEEAFYLPLADKPAFDRMYMAGQRLVSRYVQDYTGDLHRVWAVERPFALHLEDGVVSGRADVILDEENGRITSLAIVDYKLATAETRSERYQWQLQIYTAAGRGEGLTVEAAYLHDLQVGGRHGVGVAEEQVAAAVSRAAGAVKGIRCGEFAPRPEPMKCRSCDYHRVCRYTAHRPEF